MFFLIPIGAERAIYGTPWFTIANIAICVLVWVGSWFGDPIALLGLVAAEEIGPANLLYAYAHAGVFHLIGNMVFLWCMGVNLETRWGTATYAAVYLLGAIVSGLIFTMIHPDSMDPLVGASGAISALMGAFLVSLFKTKIRMAYVVWIFIRLFSGTFRIPAYVILPFWFATDLIGAYGEVRGGAAGVAYSAHVSGFVLGLAIAAGLRLTGAEKKLIEASASDVHENPADWTVLPPEANARASRRAMAQRQPPVPGNQQAAGEATAPTGNTQSADPIKCDDCGLVNMPDVSNCRRCSASIKS